MKRIITLSLTLAGIIVGSMLVPTMLLAQSQPTTVESSTWGHIKSLYAQPDASAKHSDQLQPQAGSVNWSNNIVSEAYFSLCEYITGTSHKVYNGLAMSDWPYPWQRDCCGSLGKVTAYMYYGNPNSSLRGALGTWNECQQGGECKFFVNLILYRSSYGYPGGHLVLPRGTYVYPNARSVRNAGPGWIVQGTTQQHTAIVVAVLPTGLDVVDSNYIGPHTIARHVLSWSTLSSGNYSAYQAHEACNLIP